MGPIKIERAKVEQLIKLMGEGVKPEDAQKQLKMSDAEFRAYLEACWRKLSLMEGEKKPQISALWRTRLDEATRPPAGAGASPPAAPIDANQVFLERQSVLLGNPPIEVVADERLTPAERKAFAAAGFIRVQSAKDQLGPIMKKGGYYWFRPALAAKLGLIETAETTVAQKPPERKADVEVAAVDSGARSYADKVYWSHKPTGLLGGAHGGYMMIPNSELTPAERQALLLGGYVPFRLAYDVGRAKNGEICWMQPEVAETYGVTGKSVSRDEIE